MSNNIYFTIALAIFFITFWSCGGGDEEIAGPGSGIPDDGLARLYLSIDENNFDVTVSINNFNSSITNASFSIAYDSDAFTFTKDNYSPIGAAPYYHDFDEETSTISFTYSSLGGTDRDLVVLHFNNSGNIEWVSFNITDFDFTDSNDNFIYEYCTNSQYSAPNACNQATGASWVVDGEEFTYTDVCYIDEGILEQAILGESFSLYEPTGNFLWVNSYCGYKP